jgi:hypothetical protein
MVKGGLPIAKIGGNSTRDVEGVRKRITKLVKNPKFFILHSPFSILNP